MTTLAALGPRICILGPSNSGKSTLAESISRKLGHPAVHLDPLFHQPYTDWQPRPTAEFLHLHAEAIAQAQWVMDGNYTRCLPERLARATGLIVLDVPAATSVLRYLRRCWFERNRRGGLPGGRDSVKWQMLRYITVVTPGNRQRYADIFDTTLLPKVRLPSARALQDFYRAEKLPA